MRAIFVLAGLFLLAATAVASIPQIEIKASKYKVFACSRVVKI
jgi:hypothetical protein